MQRLAFSLSLLSLALAISLVGCVQDNIPSKDSSSESTAPARGVQWPALRSLDGMAHSTGNVIQNGDVAALRAFASQMRDLSLRVAADSVPAGARNAGEVRILQADLQSLAESLTAADSLDQATLAQTLQAFGPVVHRLMAAAGVPHEHGSTHDHDDHDHDHSTAGSRPMTLKDLHEIEGPGPYGGTVLHVTHTSHLELVVDPAAATIRLMVLDGHEEPSELDDPLSAEMIFEGWDHSGKQLNIALYPDSSKVTYGHFEAFDEGLRGTEWIAGHIKGKFRESGVMTTVDVEAGWPPTHPDAAQEIEENDHTPGTQQ